MVRNVVNNPSRTEYECVECGSRFEEPHARCESLFCDGEVRDVTVARE